jgi:signal transduction histidine kinase
LHPEPVQISAPETVAADSGALPDAPGRGAGEARRPKAGWRGRAQAVLWPVPAEHLPRFRRSIAYTNWLHATWVAAVATGLNVLLSLLPEIQYYRTGLWPVDAAHLTLTGLHLFFVVFSVAAWVTLRQRRPVGPGAGEPLHERLATGYCVVMLLGVTAFSITEQQLTGSISAYLLGLAAFATLFYSPPGLSLAVCFGSAAVLIGGSVALHPDSRVVWHHAFVAFDAALLLWVGSRLGYYLKAVNFLQLVTIEDQAGALAATNAELARANQFKTDLLSLAAHDLRDPLGTISLNAQTLRDELPAGSPLQPLVANIDSSSRHLAEFVRNLLADVEAGADRISLERVPTPLPDLLEDIVAQLRVVAEAKAIQLHLAVMPTARKAPRARVDRACFRQVVENLVRNAVKYSPAQRRVWIELSHAAGEGHRLTVRDEGPGLTAADQERLFRRYQRLSAQPTRGEKSTGLGLFIVKQLVTLHQGRVWAESAGPGRGATFHVVLP